MMFYKMDNKKILFPIMNILSYSVLASYKRENKISLNQKLINLNCRGLV